MQTPFCIVSQNFAIDTNVYILLHSHTPLIFLITLIIKLPRRSHALNITKTISRRSHKFSHKITKTATRTRHYTNSISDEHTKIALSDIRTIHNIITSSSQDYIRQQGIHYHISCCLLKLGLLTVSCFNL